MKVVDKSFNISNLRLGYILSRVLYAENFIRLFISICIIFTINATFYNYEVTAAIGKKATDIQREKIWDNIDQ